MVSTKSAPQKRVPSVANLESRIVTLEGTVEKLKQMVAVMALQSPQMQEAMKQQILNAMNVNGENAEPAST